MGKQKAASAFLFLELVCSELSPPLTAWLGTAFPRQIDVCCFGPRRVSHPLEGLSHSIAMGETVLAFEHLLRVYKYIAACTYYHYFVCVHDWR